MVGLEEASSDCCTTEQQARCCEPREKQACCTPRASSCGCAGTQTAEQTRVRESVRERHARAAIVRAARPG